MVIPLAILALLPQADAISPTEGSTPLLRLDRIEVLANEDGSFVVDQLPTLSTRPGTTAVRFLAQVQPVLALDNPVRIGLSWSHQVVGYELQLSSNEVDRITLEPQLHTRLGLPTGASAELAWDRAPVRVGLGASLSSTATWALPRWTDWRVLPTLSLSWQRTAP